MNKKRRKHSEIPPAEREREPYIERDLDGYVHTNHGFCTKSAYIELCHENPDAGLPEWDTLPLMKPIDY